MTLAVRLAEAGLLTVNGTLFAELIVFILMLAVLARWAYPKIVDAAERRQRQIAEQLEAAERSRQEAEDRLGRAQQQLDDTRRQAQEIIDGANRSGEQLRAELKQKGQEEAQRQLERAQRDIEAERQRALESIREQVADLVVVATEKVLGETLDQPRHRKLIQQAVQQVGEESNGNRPS